MVGKLGPLYQPRPNATKWPLGGLVLSEFPLARQLLAIPNPVKDLGGLPNSSFSIAERLPAKQNACCICKGNLPMLVVIVLVLHHFEYIIQACSSNVSEDATCLQ